MSMATANLANAHCGVTPAGPNLVVEPRDGGTALVARLELRALTRTHNAPALEAEGRLQPALTHGHVLSVPHTNTYCGAAIHTSSVTFP